MLNIKVPLPRVHMAGSDAPSNARFEVGQHGFALFLSPDAQYRWWTSTARRSNWRKLYVHSTPRWRPDVPRTRKGSGRGCALCNRGKCRELMGGYVDRVIRVSSTTRESGKRCDAR